MSKLLTARQKARIWKGLLARLESYEWGDLMSRPVTGLDRELDWPEVAYQEQCVIALRAAARKARQP